MTILTIESNSCSVADKNRKKHLRSVGYRQSLGAFIITRKSKKTKQTLVG